MLQSAQALGPGRVVRGRRYVYSHALTIGMASLHLATVLAKSLYTSATAPTWYSYCTAEHASAL